MVRQPIKKADSPTDASDVHAVLKSLLHPYQYRFVTDQSRFVSWVASRQIGKSFAVGWRALLKASSEPRRHQTIVSAGREQSKELINKVKLHAQFLSQALNVPIIATETITTVTLVNGSVIRALAANPRTVRGYTGDLYMDELAHVQHDRALWTAVLPVITRGELTVTVASTPLGDNGIFFEVHHPKPDNPIKFSLHHTPIQDAIAAGLEVDVESLRAQFDSDTWAQEYECAFLGHAASYFPWELLRSCVKRTEDPVERSARMEHAPAFMGVDIGRKRDLTAIVILRRWPENHLWVDVVETLSDTPFQDQERILHRLIREHGVEQVCVDATGMGAHLAENLARDFGAMIQQVTFTRQSKVHLATQVRKALEMKSISLCPDGALMADCHSIQRRITSSGNMVFDATRNELGHADRFWGLALGLEAARFDNAWGVDAVDSDGKGWVDIVDDYDVDRGGLRRALKPDELGFDVLTEEDLDDARQDFMGKKRPPVDFVTDGVFQGGIPAGCVLPKTLTSEIMSRGEDPCWTCDTDRKICAGRPIKELWRSRPDITEQTGGGVYTGDALLEIVIQHGHVPLTCKLDGKTAWGLVSRGEDPCGTCDFARAVCGGRPKTEAVT